MVKKATLAAGVLTVWFLCTGVAQAQWVFVARKAIGVVNHLASQARDPQGQGYDVAVVLLEANADKIYSTALDILRGNPDVTINRTDNGRREIEITDGKVLVGMKVTLFEDHLSQLLISSSVTPDKPSGTSHVVEKVFRVCQKMGVQCTLARD